MDPVNNLLLVGTTRKNVERSPEHVVEKDEYNWYKHYKNKADMLAALEYSARCLKEEEEKRKRKKEEDILEGKKRKN